MGMGDRSLNPGLDQGRCLIGDLYIKLGSRRPTCFMVNTERESGNLVCPTSDDHRGLAETDSHLLLPLKCIPCVWPKLSKPETLK